MLKRVFSTTAIAASVILLSGCGSNIPKPTQGKEKPTVFIESKTANKFENLTEENAVWNGISPHFVKNKQYMRCDMTHEIMAAFVYNGFELVQEVKDADYRVEVEVNSCSPNIIMYADNSSGTEITEKKLYKAFAKFIEDKKTNLPSDAEEILTLISKNDKEGFKRFYDGQYIQKIDSFPTGNLGFYDKQEREYLSKTNGIVFPNKYYMMSDADKEVISHFYEITDKGNNPSQINSHIGGVNMFGGGANMVGTYGSGSAGGNMGVAFMGLGALMAFGNTLPPISINKFTIENTKNGKRTVVYGNIKEHSWHNNLMQLRGFTFGHIAWKDIN